MAEGHLFEVVEHHPEHAVALSRLGEIYMRLERWEQADTMLGRAIAILPAPDPRVVQMRARARRNFDSVSQQ